MMEFIPLCGNPWGMVLDGRSGNNGITNEKYKFTGKERDDETNYDYFDARYYDSRIGRWLQVDPLEVHYPEWNPYNYVMNNPISILDPFGKDTVYYSELPEIVVDQKNNNSNIETLESQVLPMPFPIPGPTPIPMPKDRSTANKEGESIRQFINKTIQKGKEIDLKIKGYIMIGGAVIYSLLSEDSENKTVKEVLKGKKGSIKNAPLPSGSPNWGEIENKTMKEVNDNAAKNIPGYKTIKKLLNDSRFNKGK